MPGIPTLNASQNLKLIREHCVKRFITMFVANFAQGDCYDLRGGE